MRVAKWPAILLILLFVSVVPCGCENPHSNSDDLDGAAAAAGQGDHHSSPYFKHRDYYKLTNTKSLTILSGFKTFQQTTEVHCGPAVALMVEHYFGKTGGDEITIGNLMHNADYRTAPKDEEHLYKNWATTVDQMERYFKSIGWQTSSSLTEGKLKNGATFDDFAKFKDWVIGNLKAKTPIMVEWADWGGHWQVIIGYDTMGTEWPDDDMLILADPYDTSDHRQDGYYIFNAARFFYMWQDFKYLPKAQSIQPWVIAKPPQNIIR